jgi:hypothetical protein
MFMCTSAKHEKLILKNSLILPNQKEPFILPILNLPCKVGPPWFILPLMSPLMQKRGRDLAHCFPSLNAKELHQDYVYY